MEDVKYILRERLKAMVERKAHLTVDGRLKWQPELIRLKDQIKQHKTALQILSGEWVNVIHNIPTNEQIQTESIIQTSDTDGFEILSQVYFRKGANWVRTKLFDKI